ncbi:MAG: carbon-nitrogen family hydrolase [Actinomycetes bacterium]
MRISVVQVAYGDDEPLDVRRARVEGLVRQQQGADLVVLPELWPQGGFSYRTWDRDAEPLDGPTVQRLAEVAREIGAFVHAGSVVEDARTRPGRDGRGLFNTSVLLGPDGNVVATYRKVHRFGFGAGEPKLLDAGESVVVVPLPGTDDGTGREVGVGLATCYDLRFPELFRALLDDGARLVVVPAAWPAARVAHWSLLGRARALENQLFLVAANTAGRHASTEMGGRSQVVGPTGDVLAEAGTGEEVLVADVDLAEVERVRKEFPVLQDRRLGLG